MSAAKVVIHTDGACDPNPGPGGWAAILRFGQAEKVLTGGERHTTNNRMELTAALRALEALQADARPSSIPIPSTCSAASPNGCPAGRPGTGSAKAASWPTSTCGRPWTRCWPGTRWPGTG